MSASMDLKLTEFVRGRLEDFLEAECLVGNICTKNHKIEKPSAKTPNKNINLISVKLVHKHRHKNLKQNTTISNEHGISTKTCNYHQNAKKKKKKKATGHVCASSVHEVCPEDA